jgi:zinc transport system substrate-binding protein
VLVDRVAEAAGDLVDRTLQPSIAERLNLAAVAADKVVMVIAVRQQRLVTRDAVAGVDAFHQPQVGQRLECSVHGRDPDRTPRAAERVEDLLRAHAAVLAPEEVDDRTPGAALLVAGLSEGVDRVPGPGHAESVTSPTVISRIVLILVVAFAPAGCGSGNGGGKTSVAAAFYPLAYAAERVGGAGVQVKNLTPPGAEPHDFELTPGAIGDLQRADVVLYLGRDFQPAVSKAVEEAQGEVVDLLRGLPVRENDPHVWLDPVLYARIVGWIGSVLDELARADVMEGELRRLDRDFENGLANCARREIVTSHDAFGYLARRYDLDQVSITGLEPEAEPTAQDLEHVIEVVRDTKATTVFFETLVSPRLAQAVAREVGARTAVLDPVEGLTSGGNYFTVMRENLAALRRALACR